MAAATLAWTLAAGFFTASGVFFKPMSGEFGWNRALTSGAFALPPLVSGLSAPIAGLLTDRYGPRIMALGGGFFLGLGFFLLSRLESLGQFYLFSLFIGLGMGSLFAPTVATVSRWFRKRRGLALGITTAGAGIGAMVIPPLASFLISQTGWRTAYLQFSFLAILALAIVALTLKRRPEELGLKPYGDNQPDFDLSPSAPTLSLSQSLKVATLWAVIIGNALAFVAYGVLAVHLAPYASDRGVSPMMAASLLSILGICVILGRISWGIAGDRLGPRFSLGLTFGLAALPLLLLPLATSLPLLVMFTALFGFSQGGWTGNWNALLAESFGMASLGAIQGVAETGASSGMALGVFAAGYIFDLTGLYSWAFLTGAFTLLLASGLVFSLTASRGQR